MRCRNLASLGAVADPLPRVETEEAVPLSEWYCKLCRKWNGHSCCTGCLRINPADAAWMSEYEIKRERERAMESD